MDSVIVCVLIGLFCMYILDCIFSDRKMMRSARIQAEAIKRDPERLKYIELED